MKDIHYITCPEYEGESDVAHSFLEAKGTAAKALLPSVLPFLLVALAIMLTFTSTVQAAPPYPSQPITFVVGMAAGGVTDTIARTLAEESKKILKQEILVVNKPGATQTVAMSSVITAPPDGYTLGATTDAPFVRAPYMMNLNFNPLTDTRPIIRYGTFTSAVLVPADSPFKTLKDVVDFARKNPTKLTVGHPGIATSSYLCPAGYALQQGLKISFVPFPGDSAVVTALLGKHIMIGVTGPQGCMELVRAGQLKVIGVLEGNERLDAFPQAQTLHELGMQNNLPSPSVLIFGQKNLPEPIVNKLEETFLKALQTPAWKKFAAENEVYPVKTGATGPELIKQLNATSALTGKLIHALGVAPTK